MKMKVFILIAAILSLTGGTSGENVGNYMRQLILQSLNTKENIVLIQNAPEPTPPDYSNAEVTLSNVILTGVSWNASLNDPSDPYYKQEKEKVENQIVTAMGRNFTVRNVNVTSFRQSGTTALPSTLDPALSSTTPSTPGGLPRELDLPVEQSDVTINNVAMADFDIIFASILGDNATIQDFCNSYNEIIEYLGGVADTDCVAKLIQRKSNICQMDDICPRLYSCHWLIDTGDAQCQHPCYTEQLTNPNFCSENGQVCTIDSSNPNNIQLNCSCDRLYLDTGGGCVHQNTIIIPSAVVGGILFIAIIVAVAALAGKIASKEQKEKDRKYLASEGGDFMDDTTVFNNKAYKNDDDQDSGIASPAKGGKNHEEESVYRDFEDVVVADTNPAKQNGSVHRGQEVSGNPRGKNEADDVKPYTGMTREKSVRDYTELNGGREVKEDYEPFDDQRGRHERPGYADPDDFYPSRNAPPPIKVQDDNDQSGRPYQGEKRDPVYSPLQKDSRNRVLREPNIPDLQSNRGNRTYDNQPDRRTSRTTQDDNQPYSRDQFGTGERGYNRPTRAPGIPERRYSKTEEDYGRDRNYDDDDYIPAKGSTRLGVRDSGQELNRDSYRNNWDNFT